MAKPFNQMLHNDINMLKGFNREKFPEEYRGVFSNIMKRYNISRATVYAELVKTVPGAKCDELINYFKMKDMGLHPK